MKKKIYKKKHEAINNKHSKKNRKETDVENFVQIAVSPIVAKDVSKIAEVLRYKNLLNSHQHFRILRKSIDARKKNIKVILGVEISNQAFPNELFAPYTFSDVSKSKAITIIGAGPAGIFAALELILLGIKPIIIEQGKTVGKRRRDLVKIIRESDINPTSNYCFGEGGAGTYSDGKLYTRSTKRGNVRKVLELLVQHGANENILVDAHPHIGTNKLPSIIERLRETILKSGGEIYFESKLIDFTIENHKIKNIEIENVSAGIKKTLAVDAIILATGHSGRDVFNLLYHKGVSIEAKPFALGVRIEHPQVLIDSIQYHCSIEEVKHVRKDLPAASYHLATQVNGRGVYSFCMCPGGVIAPCATENGEIVTNGWSPSKRNNPFANSGIVVSTEESDWKDFTAYGELRAMKFQEYVEKKMFQTTRSQIAPAQRVLDFIHNTTSKDLPACSYKPGILSAPLHILLPKDIVLCLQGGLKKFGEKMPHFLSPDAIIVAVESRTSSPVKIPRDPDLLHHTQILNLFPCGEGAGYAGGIVSAAIDGQRCAIATAHTIIQKNSAS